MIFSPMPGGAAASGRGALGVTEPAVQRVQRADHCFFGENTGEHAHRRRPVVITHPHGMEHRNDGPPDCGKDRPFTVLITEATIRADRIEEAQQHHDRHDDPSAAEYECVQPVPCPQQDGPGGGKMVGRQLHDKGRDGTLQHRILQQ